MPAESQSLARQRLKMAAGYGLMIVAAVVLFLSICSYGRTLTAPAAPEAAAAAKDPQLRSAPLLQLLLTLAVMIVVGRVLGQLFAYIRQPPVIGEVLAGICLGPSLLGRVWPELNELLLPASLAPSLSVVSQLGVILYMFAVGMDLNAGVLRKQGHVALAISHASIVVPFLCGAVLALWLYPILSHNGVSFTAFTLFLSVSMSITAFPVLARILTDTRMNRSPLGVMALACAATDDVSAWCLLALVVGLVQAEVGRAAFVALLTLAYIAAMVLVVRPMLVRLLARYAPSGLTRSTTAALLIGALLSALATEAIGVHAIFGAFLFGAIIPHDSPAARQLTEKTEDLVVTLLLPAFFAFTGMRTQIGLVSGLEQWLICLAIIAVATLGKFGGTFAAARWMGIGWREAASLGILMNTRGLMELIVLNIGLDLGVISPTLFAMMVLMALVTTLATSPVLHSLLRGHSELTEPRTTS